jgi:hypothetical protein
MLADYGFEAVDVQVAIALVASPRRSDPALSSAMAKAKSDNDAYSARVAAHPLGRVLQGSLVERYGERDEKLVDVLCAVSVCRAAHDIAQGRSPAEAVVVLSKDVDIVPSYGFAEDVLGVPVFAFAANAVDRRRKAYLLGSDAAFSELVATSPNARQDRLVGAELRAELADLLTTRSGTSQTWTAKWEGRGRDTGKVVLRNARGLEGVITKEGLGAWRPGRDYPLVAVNADFGDRSPLFPRAELVCEAGAVPSGDLHRAAVTRWAGATRVVVVLAGGRQESVDVSPGTLMPGDEVLVRHWNANGAQVTRLVGRLQAVPRPASWSDQSRARVVRVVGVTRHGDAVVLAADGERCILKAPRGSSPAPGQRYAAVCIDTLGSGQPLLQAVSTSLPPR